MFDHMFVIVQILSNINVKHFTFGRTTIVQNVVQMELVQHHSYFEVYTLPLVFPLMQYCKGEVVHLTLLIQHCMGDTVHIVVGGCMGSFVGRVVEPVPGTDRVCYFVLHILWR